MAHPKPRRTFRLREPIPASSLPPETLGLRVGRSPAEMRRPAGCPGSFCKTNPIAESPCGLETQSQKRLLRMAVSNELDETKPIKAKIGNLDEPRDWPYHT